MVNYEPREGVDYLTDLYQVVGVSDDASTAELKRALNERIFEYHPDRLVGLAPEFVSKGERMARLLNRARTILLDAEKRHEYDEIYRSWDGPVSVDGTPVIDTAALLRAEAAQKTPDELETSLTVHQEAVATLLAYNPNQLSLQERLYGLAASDEDKELLGKALDDALLTEDRMLAIAEAERAELLGIATDTGYRVGLGHESEMALLIDGAKKAEVTRQQQLALGNVGLRLALLAGEVSQEDATTARPLAEVPDIALPGYFDAQAERLIEIAERREEILERRLKLFTPTYPIADRQTEARPRFVVGMLYGDKKHWVGFTFDPNGRSIGEIETDPVAAQLEVEQYQAVYDAGYNILTFETKEHIDARALLAEACNKHVIKYYPEYFDEADD